MSRTGETGAAAKPDFQRFVRHAVRFGDERVVETAAEMAKAYANELRRAPRLRPVDITWMAPADRDRLLDDRVAAYADYKAAIKELQLQLKRLPAEIAAARRQAGTITRRPSVKPAARQRRSTTALREQIVALHERGVMVAAIGATLNVSDRRVREIVAQGRDPENGGHKPPVQAANRAAKALTLVGT